MTTRRKFRTESQPLPEMPSVRKLRISGEITYREAPDLREIVLGEALHSGASKLLVDLSGVERMDTAGMAVLVEALLGSRERNMGMLLCEPSDSVVQIFRLAGFPDILAACCSGFEEAQERLRG